MARRLIASGLRMSSETTGDASFVDVASHYHEQESHVKASAYMPTIGTEQPTKRAWFFVQLVTKSLTQWQALEDGRSLIRALGGDCSDSFETR
jgi:hypothetical protein